MDLQKKNEKFETFGRHTIELSRDIFIYLYIYIYIYIYPLEVYICVLIS